MSLFTFIFLIIACLIISGSESFVISEWREPGYTDDANYTDVKIPDTLSRNVIRDTDRLWPNGVVFFKIHKIFDDERVEYIYRAMRIITSISCVRFFDAPKNSTTFLGIRASRFVCQSSIGFREGIRNMYMTLDELDTKCFEIGSIVHELMHILGFIDQHQVPNRDEYVRILYENVEEFARPRFHKWRLSLTTNFSIPYDFGSIMHPPVNLLSKNGNRTIEPIVDPGDVIIGQKKSLSEMDILKLNKMYKCCA